MSSPGDKLVSFRICCDPSVSDDPMGPYISNREVGRYRPGTENPVAKKEKQREEKPRETTVEFLASLAAVLVTGLFIITFVVQAFEIPSSSMENTLLIGDHVFVNRVQFAPETRWIGPPLPTATSIARTSLFFCRLLSLDFTW